MFLAGMIAPSRMAPKSSHSMHSCFWANETPRVPVREAFASDALSIRLLESHVSVGLGNAWSISLRRQGQFCVHWGREPETWRLSTHIIVQLIIVSTSLLLLLVRHLLLVAMHLFLVVSYMKHIFAIRFPLSRRVWQASPVLLQTRAEVLILNMFWKWCFSKNTLCKVSVDSTLFVSFTISLALRMAWLVVFRALQVAILMSRHAKLEETDSLANGETLFTTKASVTTCLEQQVSPGLAICLTGSHVSNLLHPHSFSGIRWRSRISNRQDSYHFVKATLCRVEPLVSLCDHRNAGLPQVHLRSPREGK